MVKQQHKIDVSDFIGLHQLWMISSTIAGLSKIVTLTLFLVNFKTQTEMNQ